ncbi:hypothetical protein KC19_1G257400 [Ceratodon purpureus]|uniref:Secreted protein n=1 Tax=Ceratodon purpureus TaxID=3225 RepID=A0A8T0JCR4_CERPU|nr:hypothetical protein KC19_1G257400 [Ceratodon purpureus]
MALVNENCGILCAVFCRFSLVISSTAMWTDRDCELAGLGEAKCSMLLNLLCLRHSHYGSADLTVVRLFLKRW